MDLDIIPLDSSMVLVIMVLAIKVLIMVARDMEVTRAFDTKCWLKWWGRKREACWVGGACRI